MAGAESERGSIEKYRYSGPYKTEIITEIKKNQIKVLNVFLDLMLFLYSQENISIKEKHITINSTKSHIFFEEWRVFIFENEIVFKLKKLGSRNVKFVKNEKIKIKRYGVINPSVIINKIRKLKWL